MKLFGCPQINPKCLWYLRSITKECQVPAVSRPFVSGCILDIHQPFKLPQAANIRLISLRILLNNFRISTYDQLPCIRIRCTCRQKCKDKQMHIAINGPGPWRFHRFLAAVSYSRPAPPVPFVAAQQCEGSTSVGTCGLCRAPDHNMTLPPVAVSQICWTQTKKQIFCPNVSQGSHSSTWTPALQVRDCSWHSTTLNPLES